MNSVTSWCWKFHRFWRGRQSCPPRLKWLALTRIQFCSLDRPLGRIVQTQVTKSLNLPCHEDMLVSTYRTSGFSEKEKRNSWKKRKSSFDAAIAHRRSIWYQSGLMEHFGAFGNREVEVAFSRQPVSVWLAQRGEMISWDLPAMNPPLGISLDRLVLWNQSEEKELGKFFPWSNP